MAGIVVAACMAGAGPQDLEVFGVSIGYVPVEKSGVGTEFAVWLPDHYADAREIARAAERDAAF
ncbi:MAG: hypothetical protein OXF26_14510 [Alphaproteobacteria bacterium]|nr:hypothetical protein [Alphaproteobacteria bacterium]MCY4319317.1 hypothetical protein [Alphaproteobacteria bacterium]